MAKGSKRELKPVSFNDSEKDRELLAYMESMGVSFSSYVKLLIRKDMEGAFDKVKTAPATPTGGEMAEIAGSLKELVQIFKSGTVSIGTQRAIDTDSEACMTLDTDNETVVEDTNILRPDEKQKSAMSNFMNAFPTT